MRKNCRLKMFTVQLQLPRSSMAASESAAEHWSNLSGLIRLPSRNVRRMSSLQSTFSRETLRVTSPRRRATAQNVTLLSMNLTSAATNAAATTPRASRVAQASSKRSTTCAKCASIRRCIRSFSILSSSIVLYATQRFYSRKMEACLRAILRRMSGESDMVSGKS